MGIFEWFAGLNTWVKVSVSLLLILSSTLLWFAGWFWPWGWAVGVILLLCSFPNDVQKRGYHD